MSTARDPIRLGCLDDTPRGVDRALLGRALEAARLRAARAGRFRGMLDLVCVRAERSPGGGTRAVEQAYARLARADVVAVLGPAIGDAALVATPLAREHRVPTINFAGTERARGEWMFHLQIGSHEEEPSLLARQLVRDGVERVALVFERGVIGERYATFFAAACAAEGLALKVRSGLGPEDDPAPVVRAALASRPEALVYLGLGLGLPRFSAALAATGFDDALACNSCGMFGWAGTGHREALEGWRYVDVWSEDNAELGVARRALGLSDGDGPTGVIYADLATLVVEGLARAPEPTRPGVLHGLERVKALPAALGAAGTQLGFGTWDRAALKGPYLVPRRWRGGRSVPWHAG